MRTFSEEHLSFIKKIKRRNILVRFSQIVIIVFLLLLWELLARSQLINTFLTGSPSSIFKTLVDLFNKGNLLKHIFVTLYETVLSFSIASILGIVLASLLWWNKFIADTIDPYLTVLNSLPKVALGPLIIIWVGANTNSIIFMALMISLFISIINIYNGFINVDKDYITLLKSFNASKFDIYKNVILPSNKLNIINSFKINISMSLIGVIMGELLVSKEGLGYLIMYGSQVFNINLVITSVAILAVISYLIYEIVSLIEKRLLSK